MRQIGEILREFRQKAGLTQKEVAMRVGLSPLMVHRMEKGTRTTKSENFYKYCKAVGCLPIQVWSRMLVPNDATEITSKTSEALIKLIVFSSDSLQEIEKMSNAVNSV